MKPIILSLTVLEFTWFVIDGSMEENGLAYPLLQKNKLSPPIKKVPKKSEIFPDPSYKIKKNFLAPTKNYLWMGVGNIYHEKQGYKYRLPESS